MPEVVRERGGTPIRTRVGHCFIKAVMAETGAAFGGEHSAHYYFRENYRADSGSIAALVVLEQLALAGVPLSELRKPFERYAASGEINFRGRRPARRHRAGRRPLTPTPTRTASTASPSTSAAWWFNLRPSQHRAPAAPQPRGARPAPAVDAAGRRAAPHLIKER